MSSKRCWQLGRFSQCQYDSVEVSLIKHLQSPHNWIRNRFIYTFKLLPMAIILRSVQQCFLFFRHRLVSCKSTFDIKFAPQLKFDAEIINIMFCTNQIRLSIPNFVCIIFFTNHQFDCFLLAVKRLIHTLYVLDLHSKTIGNVARIHVFSWNKHKRIKKMHTHT